jgi:hypothetical protein
MMDAATDILNGIRHDHRQMIAIALTPYGSIFGSMAGWPRRPSRRCASIACPLV